MNKPKLQRNPVKRLPTLMSLLTSKSEGEIIHRVLMCAAAGALFISTAKADETLKFRVVQYVASVQSQQVGDVNGHVQAFVRYPGLASFPDGSIARTTVFNASDGILGLGGGGTVNGYENIVFSDGSELWWKERTKSTALKKLPGTALLL